MSEHGFVLEIDSNPGGGRVGDGDWSGYMGNIRIEDCSHGGSIAQIEIRGYGDDTDIAAFLELTPEDVDELIDTLREIRENVQPEMETDTVINTSTLNVPAPKRATVVEDLDDLKAKVRDGEFEYAILLAGGLAISRKTIKRGSKETWKVHNHIDDTRQTLTDKTLWTDSNIGEALDKHALVIPPR